MKRTQYLLLCLALIWSCIPIVDKIAPTIQDINNLRLVYHIQDTIQIFLTYRDNSRLDSVTVSINRQVPPANNPWRYFSRRSIKGRRYEDTLKIPIPKDAPLGIYNLSVRLQDFSKLQSVPKDTIFELLGDNRPPRINNLLVISTGVGVAPERDIADNFITCRSSIIQLSGLITDNIRVREVRVSLNDGATNLLNTARVVNSDTVRLVGLFDRDIRIPSNVPDGRILRLTVTALDGEGNSASQSFNFIINCDDQTPSLNITRTSPQINANREVNVIEGSNFRILEGTATDNRGLGTLTVTFNEVNQPRRVVFERNLSGATNVNLAELFASANPNLFQPPANAPAGAIYELIISVRDIAGNLATPIRILITVIRDEPPAIFIANVYVDGKELVLSPTSANIVGRGQTVQIEGKIEDDSGLEYIQILWGPPGQETTIVNLKGEDITLPFDFANPISVNRFKVPDSRVVDTHNLIVKVKDLKNPEVVRQITFLIR
ncbi:MAG: hypothetical protein OHK0057_27190 [Thermoflexibacter sp.]